MELGRHRHELVGVADPDRRDVLRGVADEPRVAEVLGCAGLPGDLAARQRRRLAGPRAHDTLEERVDRVRLCRRQDAMGDDAVLLGALADVDRLHDPRLVVEDRAVDPDAAVGERLVRASHLERRRRLGAEADREVAVELARDAERVGGVPHVAGADERRQL